jgi:photosystem II stability/assembly factor-like uncharacterized protein
MKKLILIAFCLLSGGTSTLFAQNSWTPLGGMTSGSTNNITVDSLNRIYVCTGGDGVLQSTDGGLTWHGFNQGLRVLPFRMLESSTIEYGGPNGTVAYVYGASQRNEIMRRLFNTTSQDVHWEYLSNIVNQDTVHNSTPVIEQIMTNHKGYLYLATASFGVLRSRDHGETFDKIPSLSAPIPDSFVVCMAINRMNQDLYAISQSNVKGQHNPDKWINHISYSTDDGTSWLRLPTLPPYPVYIRKILIADDGSILLGYQVNIYDTTKVYRSTDMGQTWTGVLFGPIGHHIEVDALFHAVKGHDLYVNLHGPTYRSTDNGASWHIRNPEKKGEETFWVACDTNNKIFQTAIPDGVYRLDDDGLVMNDMNADLAVQHLDGGITVDSKGRIYSCSQFNMYRSTDQGKSWYNLPTELDEAQFPYFITDQRDNVYYNDYYGMHRSTDYGETFKDIIGADPNQTLPAYKLNQVWCMGANVKDEIFASSQSDPKGTHQTPDPWFVMSQDHGDTWKRLNNADNTNGGIPKNESIYCFDFSKTNGDTIYASSNTVIYRSINHGVNWEIVKNDTSVNGMRQIICHPDGSVFRCQGGGGSTDGIFRSVDGGVNWTKVFPNDNSMIIPDYSQVVPMLLDRNGRILVSVWDYSPGGIFPDGTSTHTGIWMSTNSDFTQWKQFSDGIIGDDWYTDRYLNVSQVGQDRNTGYYYANSRGRSVFKSTYPDFVAGVPRSPMPISMNEPKNYPNPFAKITEISFTTSHEGNVKISLYDVMGRFIRVIENEYMEAGKHTLTFNSNGMSSGQYMIMVQSGTEVTNHWMTVTK